MRERGTLERLAAGDVDVAGLGEARHDDTRDAFEDLVGIERRREQRAGLREQTQALVRATLCGHLHDHRPDAGRLAGFGAHGVVARDPVPFGAAGADRLLVRHRVAGLEHAPVERLETRRELRDHLLQRLADVILDRQRIELGKRVVQADEPELAVPEADPDRRRDEQRVEQRVRLVDLAVEPGVLEGERDAAADDPREGDVLRRVPAPRDAGPERQRPDRAAARDAGDDNVRARLEPLVERQVLVVECGLPQHRGIRDLDQQRLSGREDLRGRMRGFPSGG